MLDGIISRYEGRLTGLLIIRLDDLIIISQYSKRTILRIHFFKQYPGVACFFFVYLLERPTNFLFLIFTCSCIVYYI